LAATPEDVFVIGRIIDNYEIRSLLGEGEVGSVYLCEHTFITRRVAIKVLRRAYSQDEAKVARFMADARAANNLGHPEIAHIVDMGRLAPEVGQSEDGAVGLPYVMREWLDGETLAQRIGRLGKVPLYEAVGIAKQACAALVATHAAGIVHGDLKPENFLLGDGLRGARLKLLDFGIAHLRDTAAPLDVRTDVRALGAILQAMLAGPSPNPDLPRWMERIIERADGQEPETRFETMAALAAALEDGPHVRVTAEARAAAIAAPAGESAASTPTPLPGMTPPAIDVGDVGVGDVSVGDAPVADGRQIADATPRLWAAADADDPRASMITPPPVANADAGASTPPPPVVTATAPAATAPWPAAAAPVLTAPWPAITVTPAVTAPPASWPATTTPAVTATAAPWPAATAPALTAPPVTRPTPTRPRKTLEELRRTLQQASSRRDTPAYPFLVPSPPPTPLPDPRAQGPFSHMLEPRRSRRKVVVGAALLLAAGYLWAPWSPRNRLHNPPPPVATERAVAAPVAPPPPATAATTTNERPTDPPAAPAALPAPAPAAKATPAAPATTATADPKSDRAPRNPPAISWEITPENAIKRPSRQPNDSQAGKPAAPEKPARPERPVSSAKPARPVRPAHADADDSEATSPSERPAKAARAEKPSRPASPRAPGAATPMDKW
jgi:hypothetical protein